MGKINPLSHIRDVRDMREKGATFIGQRTMKGND